MIKKFLIWFVKSLIMLVIVTFVFASITTDLPDLLKGIFSDVFEYASPNVQKQVINSLAETCSSLDQGESLVSINQICNNASLLNSLKENCNDYRELKSRGIKIDNEEQVRETCEQLESGELDKACNQIHGKSSLAPDLSRVGVLCKDYKEGKINDKEFFFNIIGSAIPSQLETSQIKAFEKYNKIINYLNTNKIIYLAILLILVLILYLLIKNIKLFLLTLSVISFSIGIFILTPYLVILAYDKFIGIDTTGILSGLLGNADIFNAKSILSVILLMFLRTYNSFIITIGIIFLSLGIAGKIYQFYSKRKSNEKQS